MDLHSFRAAAPSRPVHYADVTQIYVDYARLDKIALWNPLAVGIRCSVCLATVPSFCPTFNLVPGPDVLFRASSAYSRLREQSEYVETGCCKWLELLERVI